MKQLSLFAVVVLAAAASSACGKECEAIANKVVECEESGGGGPDKGQIEAACELMMASDEGKKELEETAKCAKLESCEEYKACQAGARAGQAADRIAKEASEGKWEDALMSCRVNVEEYKASDKLKAACDKVFTEGLGALIEGGKGEEAMSACKYSDDLLAASDVFKAECSKAASGALEGATKKAVAFRDEGKDDYGACSDLKELAAKADGSEAGENTKAAEQLCAEMKVAGDAAEGMKEAKANIAAKKADLPFGCERAREGFGKMAEKSDWSKAKLAEVLQTCYVDLGKTMIEKELPNMKYICPFQIKKVRKAIEEHGLKGKDAALDELLAKTDKKCSK